MTTNVKRYSFGIDVSKASLDCYALNNNEYKKFANTARGIACCMKWMMKEKTIHRIVLEPTGCYEKHLMKQLHKHSFPVSLVNPRFIYHFGLAMKDKAKTDRLDAHKMALYAEHISPAITNDVEPIKLELSAIIDRRAQLIGQLKAEKNRIEKNPHASIKKSLERSIEWLKKEIEDLDVKINSTLKSHSLNPLFCLLKRLKGLGQNTIACILAYLPEIGTLSSKEVAKLVGVAPLNKESGKLLSRAHIRGGRHKVRRNLYMATLVAVRHNKALKKIYLNLRENGKKPKVALVAAMRKLIVWINAIVKNYFTQKKLVIPS